MPMENATLNFSSQRPLFTELHPEPMSSEYASRSVQVGLLRLPIGISCRALKITHPPLLLCMWPQGGVLKGQLF